MEHLRMTVWGPAEFVGAPPWYLVVEGVVTGVLGVGAVVGVTLFGAWQGRAALADGEAGLVCAAAVAVYLSAVRAGRALVGIAAVLGVCLALQAPQAAAGMVLAERGRVQSAEVTSVERTGEAGRHHLCSLADADGVPLSVRVWRGCHENTRPGDTVAVVYDPRGLIPPRGVDAELSWKGPLTDLAGAAGALLTSCVVAVVRSHRITSHRHGSV